MVTITPPQAWAQGTLRGSANWDIDSPYSGRISDTLFLTVTYLDGHYTVNYGIVWTIYEWDGEDPDTIQMVYEAHWDSIPYLQTSAPTWGGGRWIDEHFLGIQGIGEHDGVYYIAYMLEGDSGEMGRLGYMTWDGTTLYVTPKSQTRVLTPSEWGYSSANDVWWVQIFKKSFEDFKWVWALGGWRDSSVGGSLFDMHEYSFDPVTKQWSLDTVAHLHNFVPYWWEPEWEVEPVPFDIGKRGDRYCVNMTTYGPQDRYAISCDVDGFTNPKFMDFGFWYGPAGHDPLWPNWVYYWRGSWSPDGNYYAESTYGDSSSDERSGVMFRIYSFDGEDLTIEGTLRLEPAWRQTDGDPFPFPEGAVTVDFLEPVSAKIWNKGVFYPIWIFGVEREGGGTDDTLGIFSAVPDGSGGIELSLVDALLGPDSWPGNDPNVYGDGFYNYHMTVNGPQVHLGDSLGMGYTNYESNSPDEIGQVSIGFVVKFDPGGYVPRSISGRPGGPRVRFERIGRHQL